MRSPTPAARRDDGLPRRHAVPTNGTRLFAQPSTEREYDAVGLWTSEWPPDDDLEFDEFQTNGLAFAGDTAYVSLGRVDRLVSITPDGEHRTLVARRPDRDLKDPAIPGGDDTEVRRDFFAGRVAAGPDGSVYVVAGRPGGALARRPADDPAAALRRGDRHRRRRPRGDLRRRHQERPRPPHRPDGSVRTVVGTEAPRDCVENGLDDPLALDPRRCTAVAAIAVDRAGNLYLALQNLAMIVGVTPDGEMASSPGPGRRASATASAVEARLGLVEELAVGPDGDLYVSESDRGPADRRPRRHPRRRAARARAAARARVRPATRSSALNEAAAGVTDGDALERALNALADAPPRRSATTSTRSWTARPTVRPRCSRSTPRWNPTRTA